MEIVMSLISLLLLIGGLIGLLVGYIWLLVVAFRSSMGWFLAMLFLSVIGVPLFLVYHWDEAKRPLLTLVTAVAVLFVGLQVSQRVDHMKQIREEREAIIRGE